MSRRIWTSGRTEWALFLLLFFSAANFHHPKEYDNTQSRYFLLSSVVDYHRLDLAMFLADGGIADLSMHNGRYYSNKPPGLPLLAAPVYWGMRKFTVLKRRGVLSKASAYITRVWAVSLPYALMGPILYQLLLSMGFGAGEAFLVVIAYAFGTLAWVHASLFSGHQTAACLSFFSFAACWRLARDKDWGAGRWCGAGVLAGLAALCDYQAGFTAVLLGAYSIWRGRGIGPRAGFAAGLAICGAVLGAYNFMCFGAPWSLSLANEGPAWIETMRRGFIGLEWPRLSTMYFLLLSPARGLFFTMPVLAMAVPGYFALARKGDAWRAELALFLVVPGVGFLINSGYVGWHAGWTFGPRYLVSTLPFFCVPLAFGLDRYWFIPLFAFSVFQMGMVQFVMPHTPQYILNPIVELLVPLFRDGYQSGTLGTLLGLSGVFSIFPWAAIIVGLAVWGWPENVPWAEALPRRASLALSSVYGIMCVGMLVSWLVVRSPDPRSVQGYVEKLLSDYSDVVSDPAVEAAARRERALRLSRGKAQRRR